MAAITGEREFCKMITQAMKDRAPAMYRELKSQGLLDQVVAEREQLARENHYHRMGIKISELSRNPDPNPIQHVALMEAATRESWELAIEEATTFA